MGQIRCNARGCERTLWIPRVGLEGRDSSSTCEDCKQVALCVEHFAVLWKRGGECPKCRSQRWSVHLFEGSPFSPMLQAELITRGGQLNIIDQTHAVSLDSAHTQRSRKEYHSKQSDYPNHNQQNASSDDPYLRELAESSADRSMVTLNVAAKSQQSLRKATLDPHPPRPESHHTDPFDKGSPTYIGRNLEINGQRDAHLDDFSSHERALPPPPKGWRLITQSDLSERARGLGCGIAIEREGPHLIRMMDDDRIIRQIELEGDILHISQSPRKQRLIVERSRDGQREVVYFRGKELQGFITNPVVDDLELFGAEFFSETGFVVFTVRPDYRLDLREGRFKKSRQVQTRVIGASIKSAPLPPSMCNKGHLAFFFKEVSENRFLPLCRRISNGEDVVVSGELTERPMIQAASRDSTTLAWITQTKGVWVSRGSQHPSKCITETSAHLLAVSSDGRQVAWAGENEFCTYHVESQRIESWERPKGLLAIGWREQF